jgi:hypothetical protein
MYFVFRFVDTMVIFDSYETYYHRFDVGEGKKRKPDLATSGI